MLKTEEYGKIIGSIQNQPDWFSLLGHQIKLDSLCIYCLSWWTEKKIMKWKRSKEKIEIKMFLFRLFVGNCQLHLTIKYRERKPLSWWHRKINNIAYHMFLEREFQWSFYSSQSLRIHVKKTTFRLMNWCDLIILNQFKPQRENPVCEGRSQLRVVLKTHLQEFSEWWRSATPNLSSSLEAPESWVLFVLHGEN